MNQLAIEILNAAIADDLEPAEEAARGGDASAALTRIEAAIAKVSNVVDMLHDTESQSGSVGPVL